MKNFFRTTMAVMIALLTATAGCLAADTGEIHEVEVVGEGTDAESALQAAFVKALQTTIGVVVHSQTTVKNYKLTDDLLRVLTNGCIESYEELLSQSHNGVTRIVIRARVRRGIVADFLGVQRVKRQVELKDEWARLSTAARGREQAVQMLRSLVMDISPKLYKVTLIDLQSGAEVGVNANPLPLLEQAKDSTVFATWAALITPDLDFWDNEAAPLNRRSTFCTRRRWSMKSSASMRRKDLRRKQLKRLPRMIPNQWGDLCKPWQPTPPK